MPSFRELQFYIEEQNGRNWCWAAVSSSISKYYDYNSIWTQCRIASRVFNDNCCPAQAGGPCDERARLEYGLEITNTFSAPVHQGALGMQQIINEVEKKRVIGIRIKWDSGNGHFIVIHGYDHKNGIDWLIVSDPLRGRILLPHSEVISNYNRNGGIWSYTYFTKEPMQPIADSIAFSINNRKLLKKLEKTKYERHTKQMRTIKWNELQQPVLSYAHFLFVIQWRPLKNKSEFVLAKSGQRIIKVRKKKSLFSLITTSMKQNPNCSKFFMMTNMYFDTWND